jgi:carboxyl-terminal processing protease
MVNNMRRNKFKINLLIIIAITGIFFFTLISKIIVNSQNDSIFNDLEPFLEVLSIIRSDYIDQDISINKLVPGAIKGMLLELDDPYSRYMDPMTFQREQENLFVGHFYGLGITVAIVDEQLTVISPIEDTPAYIAGIKANDKILEIDGETTKGISLDEAVDILRGEKGVAVTLTIKRENREELLKITVIRDTIEVEAVKEKLLEDDRVGYIRISTFNANTAPELKQVLNNFTELSLEGIVVDLRNNPGGLLESSIEVASQFVKEGDIVKIKGRNHLTKSYYTYGNNYPDWPMVILINKGSASASEIVAGAIQDSKRGIAIGETSFGKGLVQQIYPLSDNSAVTISTSEYYTPNGRVINDIGIEPDIIIISQEDSEEDVQLNAALHYLLEDLINVE